jgi:hypothetical protein
MSALTALQTTLLHLLGWTSRTGDWHRGWYDPQGDWRLQPPDLLADPRLLLAWLQIQPILDWTLSWSRAAWDHPESTRCTVHHAHVGRLRGEGLASEGPQTGIAVGLAALLVDRVTRRGKGYRPVLDLPTWQRWQQRREDRPCSA